MTRRREQLVGLLLVCGALLSGCEDSAAGFAAGMGEAILLLFLLGLILPAAVMGLIVALVVSVKRRRERRGPL